MKIKTRGEIKKMIENEGRKCLLIKGDIRKKSFCKTSIDKVYAEFGMLNILVNNAAEEHLHNSMKEIDLNLVEKTFQTNILSMFYLTKEALKYMSEGDVIINNIECYKLQRQ